MNGEPTKPAHAKVEAALGRTLTMAVLVSAAVAATGAVLYLRQHVGEHLGHEHLEHEHPDFSAYVAESPDLTSPAAILHGALQGSPGALMQLGIFILVLTPVARVVFSLTLFGLRRDRMYTLITLAVLAVLLAGLLGAVA